MNKSEKKQECKIQIISVVTIGSFWNEPAWKIFFLLTFFGIYFVEIHLKDSMIISSS